MIKCLEYYNTDLYKFGKDKNHNQKYLCKKYHRQFTLQSSKKYLPGYLKSPVCGKNTFIHHKHKYHVSFKCSDRKCNHTFKQVISNALYDPSSENISDKSIFF